jgi:hypothetical protein
VWLGAVVRLVTPLQSVTALLIADVGLAFDDALHEVCGVL